MTSLNDNYILPNSNFSISNSIILNNYSIQNVISSKNNMDFYDKFPFNNENIFQVNKIQNIFSPNFKKYSAKRKVFLDNQSSSLYNYYTPMPQKKFYSKFNQTKIEKINLFNNSNNVIPKLIPTKLRKPKKVQITYQKHPEDSVKKNITKNKFLNYRNLKKEKNLKNSLSQKFFESAKSQRGILHNLSLEHSNRYQKKFLEIGPKNSKSTKKSRKRSPKNSKTLIYKEPTKDFNLEDFQFRKAIGKGTFGNIFGVKWIKNNKYYAMKKEILYNIEDIINRRKAFKIMQTFLDNTGSKGITKLYGNLCLKNNSNKENIPTNQFIYYELMEKAERDWDDEISERSDKNNFYSEKEILNIISQLVKTLSLMQKNHITHRDIKPQNILILKGNYKLCDFGEIRVLERAGLIVQRVRGSELYMSPILFDGLHRNLILVKHNTYKSDVFSLGMCLFYACSLTYSGVDSIREINDMNIIKKILFEFLNERYSEKLILFILSMLEVDESKRCNFIQLEEKLKYLLL